MEKIRYEIDPHNRLIFRKTRLPGFRKVLDGKFKTDRNNILTYHVKAPAHRDTDIPHQVKLRGKWSLTGNHDLKLTLDKWGRKTYGDQLTLKGDMVDVRKNSLLFAVTTRTKESVQSTYILELKGSWQANKQNRLTFRVKKEKGRHDILVLDNIWEVNRNHQIIYRYRKARLIRKKSKISTIIFKGYWDIWGKARITYVIDKNSRSAFHFRSSAGIFKHNYIKYEVGIGARGKQKTKKRIVYLFGKWKIIKNTGLLFEIRYENNKFHAIIFGAQAKLGPGTKVSFKIRNAFNEDIGATLKLSRRILKGDGQLFLRLLKSKREASLSAGGGWRW